MQIIQKRSAQPDQWPAVWPPISDKGTEPEADVVPDRQQVDDFLASNPGARILVRFDTWLQYRQRLSDVENLGVVLETDMDLTLLGPEIRQLSLIKVAFKAFNDGKGYSIASILRNEYQYEGELRATNVVKENLAFLEQCGFDSYELVAGTDLNGAIGIFDQLVPDSAA